MAEQITLPWVAKDVLSVTETAQLLGLSAQMVRHLCNTGKLPHTRLFGHGVRVFQRQEVLDFKSNREVGKLMLEFFRPQSFTVRYARAARRG